ncbi:MAG: LacI family DNA-binding transcriptional regulator [Alphaproteobacteria bacterium]
MARPTIRDLAQAAGVSVSTVNRVLGNAGTVRQATMQRVHAAAERIGFYGLGAIRSHVAASRPKHRFGFLLQQPTRAWYRSLGQALEAAAARIEDREIDVRIEFAADLSPQHVASRLVALGDDCDAVGVVAAVHPLVKQAVETLRQRGVPVFALISQLSATGDVHYVGLDNWKVGRTAAWAFAHICRAPGKLGILVGNHRYRCQEMNESGFRSYFREFAPAFTLLEPLSTFETAAIAEEMTERLLREHPDLTGLFISGGGITGAIAALRASGRAGDLVAVGYEMMDATRTALVDGVLTLVIAHPLARLAAETIGGMIAAAPAAADAATRTVVLPFDIFTRENI